MCKYFKFQIFTIALCLPKFLCAEDNNPSQDEPSRCSESHLSNSQESSSIRHRNARELPATKFLDGLLGEQLFNTTMNFIVPGFHVVLPKHSEDGSLDHLAMQAFFGLFWAIAWISTIAIPTIVTYFQPLGIRSFHNGNEERMYSKDSINDNDFKLKWNLNAKVAEAIGLNWTTCLQKTICQAHEHPQKYGIMGDTVRIIFPHPKHGDVADDSIDATENNVFGESDCNHHHRCFFDVLDVLTYVKNYCYASTHYWN